MRNKSSLILTAAAVFSVFYFSVYLYMWEDLNLWITDLKSCFKVMDLTSFVVNHLNIFLYLLVFSVMSFYIVKFILKTFETLYSLYLINKNIQTAKIYSFKNITVINSDDPVSVNFLSRIILSKGFFRQFDKKERRAIFYHEMGHLKNLDSIRYLIMDLLSFLLPEKLKKSLMDNFVISSELGADRYALEKIDKKDLLEVILNVRQIRSRHPLMSNFTHSRVVHLLENTEPSFPKILIISVALLTVLGFAIFVYKTCFCGVMG